MLPGQRGIVACGIWDTPAVTDAGAVLSTTLARAEADGRTKWLLKSSNSMGRRRPRPADKSRRGQGNRLGDGTWALFLTLRILMGHLCDRTRSGLTPSASHSESSETRSHQTVLRKFRAKGRQSSESILAVHNLQIDKSLRNSVEALDSWEGLGVAAT
jgi:hypothetical protein